MPNNASFENAIKKTLKWEGGYANDPHDAGGETNFGISKAAYPNVDIRNLTVDQARFIYLRDYWEAPGIDALPGIIAEKVFDLGVNMGPATAIRLLQHACNIAGWRPDLAADGVIGPHTVEAATGLDRQVLLMVLRDQAAAHYRQLARTHAGLKRYLPGWLKRAAE